MPIPLGEFTLRLAAGFGLGSAIGIERQLHHHMAGLKTNALVATGSSLFMMMPLFMGGSESASRVGAQIISGIGFLGGGVILRDGFHVRGLNTAATLWCSAAVGTLAGLGEYWAAAIGTGTVLLVNIGGRPVSRLLGEEGLSGSVTGIIHSLRVVASKTKEQELRARIVALGEKSRLTLVSMKVEPLAADTISIKTEFAVPEDSTGTLKSLIGNFHFDDGVVSAEWQTVEPLGTK
jgi:putative Mg2+ transporter-C (MgtC) family protein